MPGISAVNAGFTAVGLLSTAALPCGNVVKLHWYVRGRPLPSVDFEPSNCTRDLILTTWPGPALATGATIPVLIVTVDGTLLNAPSFTINCATQVASGLSATNVGVTVLAPVSIAALPEGMVISVQE